MKLLKAILYTAANKNQNLNQTVYDEAPGWADYGKI